MIEIKIKDLSKDAIISILTPYEKQKICIAHYIKKEVLKAPEYNKMKTFNRLSMELSLSVQRVRDIFYKK